MGIIRHRVTIRWPGLFVAAFFIVWVVISLQAHADAPRLTVQVCRANVDPCQNQVSIAENDTSTLQLVISANDLNEGDSPPEIVAWETHFRLTGSSIAQLVPDSLSGQPVQQQGDPDLALEGLASLTGGGNQDGGQFLAIQNQFDQTWGKLDYAVTLVAFDQDQPQTRVLPFANGDQLRLGHITLRGISEGTFTISPASSVDSSFQVVTLASPGGLTSFSPATPSNPQVTINVGKVSTVELQGQVVLSGPTGVGSPDQFPRILTVTFWRTGAVPAWQGGDDLPVATFYKVAHDVSGAFRITDIAPSLLSPGNYDLRVNGRRTLTSLVSGVTIPPPAGPGDPSPTAIITISGIPDGDIDGNNIIDRADLDTLKVHFGRLVSEPGADANADLNGDNLIDVLDFTRLARNFGKTGD